jgi:hypothetical protein
MEKRLPAADGDEWPAEDEWMEWAASCGCSPDDID